MSVSLDFLKAILLMIPYIKIESMLAEALTGAVNSVLSDLKVDRALSADMKVELEIPKDKSHGDLSSNIAMRACKHARQSPLALASLVKAKLDGALTASGLDELIEKVEIKPPGFINFFFSKACLYKIILDIHKNKHEYGKSDIGKNIKVQVEFVSANPTGPLTIAHGRQAALGDSLANILKFQGYDVTREYYLNDEGTQMDILANSIRVRYRNLLGIEEAFPADAYKGSYIIDIAKDFRSKYGEEHAQTAKLDIFRQFGLEWILGDIKKDLEDFGVKFDVWFSQKKLRESGKIEKALQFLKDKGYIYESEGAVWFKSKELGDDKDRVVIKSDGHFTYLAPDMAYHLEKYRRGFNRIIDIWGPDHHGYIPRMKAAIRALGFSEESLSVLIVQLATLYKSGKVVSMSTRAGEFVTLREVIDEVGKDVARFCFIMRKASSHLDFDLDAVKKESMENPVYYIQYAHARICSILKFSEEKKLSAGFDSKLLKEAEELELSRALGQFPAIVAMSGKALEPYVILQYLQDLARAFHSFYTKHRVVSDDLELTRSRLVLVDCVRTVLANGLRLLGVSLPEKM